MTTSLGVVFAFIVGLAIGMFLLHLFGQLAAVLGGL